MSKLPSATVVVARTALDGMHEEAEVWLQQILTLAAHANGYVRGEIQRPGTQHPNEWVVVYEFSNSDTLNGWLRSPERIEICEQQAALFEGPAREQVLATAGQQNAVTGVSSFLLRAPADRREANRVHDEFAAAYAGLVAEVERFDGCISCDLLEAKPGIQEEMVVVFSFESREQLDAWFRSEKRKALLEQIDPLLAGERTTNVVGGFAGWFAPGRSTPTWKQATLVLAALYPTALAIGFIRNLVAPDLPFTLATFIGNAIGVAILSWVAMPPLTRKFQRWLTR